MIQVTPISLSLRVTDKTMGRLLVIGGVLLALLSACGHDNPINSLITSNKLIGTWKFVSASSSDFPEILTVRANETRLTPAWTIPAGGPSDSSIIGIPEIKGGLPTSITGAITFTGSAYTLSGRVVGAGARITEVSATGAYSLVDSILTFQYTDTKKHTLESASVKVFARGKDQLVITGIGPFRSQQDRFFRIISDVKITAIFQKQ